MTPQSIEPYVPARTIDEVIAQLNAVIDRARREKSRLGYFAVLYRNVTIKVKEGIAAGHFEDGERMERLDVIFANRYLDAYECFRRGGQTTKCWNASFRSAARWRPLVLQHLLLGINAHINLDLGVAAALTSPGDQLPSLKHDFDEINKILHSMIDDVEDKLGMVWMALRLLDRLGWRVDETLVSFSIDTARVAAWDVAQRLAPLGPDEMQTEIDRLDRHVELLAALISNPGFYLSVLNLWIRLRERGDVPHIIDVLSRESKQA